MTSEPKFVPEEAVQISPGNGAALSVRLIDSVGYMIPGALGAEEDNGGIPAAEIDGTLSGRFLTGSFLLPAGTEESAL